MSRIAVGDGALCTEHDMLLQRIAALEQTEREYHRLQQKYQHMLAQMASMEQANVELEARVTTLEQHQTFLQSFVEHAPGLLSIKDIRGRYLLVNQRTAALLHRDPDQIVGKTDCELFSAHVATTLRNHDCQVIATGKPLEVEEVVPTEAGLSTYVSVKFPIYDTNGTIYATGGISTDMSEHKRMEHILRDVEERFRIVANFTYNWEYWVDPSGNFRYVSPSCERITGYRPEEFQQNPVLMEAILHPKDRLRITSHLHDTTNREAIRSTEFRIITKSGEERWIGHVCQPVYSSDGCWMGRRASNRDITDRVRVEEAYCAVVSLSMQAFVIFQDHRVVLANPAAAQITGYTIEELIAMTPQEAEAIIHPDDHPMVVEHSTQRINGKQVLTHYNFRLIRKGGEVRWVEAFSTVIAYRERPAVQMAYIDITERMRAENALRQSQHLLENIFAALCDAVFTLDADTRIIGCNPAATNIFGYTSEEILGQPIAFLHADTHTLQEFHRYLFRVVQEPGASSLPEFTMKRKDGTCFPTEHSAMPFANQGGKYVGWVSVVRDITERKQAEQTLRESEERYRLMADHATDMISRHALDGTYLYASPVCHSLLGYTPDELVGRNSYDFFHPDDQATIHTSYTTILNGTGSHAFSYRTRHKDGHYIWFETTGKTIRDPQSGTVVEILAISRDITERKRIEIELEQSLALLQATFDSTADGIIVSTLDQRIISHNQKFRQIWRLPEDWESLPDTLPERLTFLARQVTDPQGFVRRIEEVSRLPEAEAYDIIELHDGRIFERYSTPYRVAGRIAGRVWSFQDVTNQKRAEAELRASRTRLQAIFDNAAVGIVLFDCAGHFVDVNNRAAEMLRCSVDDMYRMNVRDTTHLEDREESKARLHRLIHGMSDGYRIERRILRRDGSMFWGDITTAIIRHSSGSVEAIIAVVADITERKEAEVTIQQVNEKLKQQALRDPLTGLFNRRYLNETLPRELQRVSRQKQPLSVILLDIDHFKRFNDTYGHDAGDAVLRAVGSVLQTRIRGDDVVCRYGGEEFVVILPGASLEDTWRRAEELCTRIRYLSLKHNGYPLQAVTISVGIAISPQHGTVSDTLMKVADSALYRAKAMGRDCIVMADLECETRLQENHRGE